MMYASSGKAKPKNGGKAKPGGKKPKGGGGNKKAPAKPKKPKTPSGGMFPDYSGILVAKR